MTLTRVGRMECPACGANLEKGAPGMWVCPYCGSQYKDNSAPAPAPAKPAAPAVPRSAAPIAAPKPAPAPAPKLRSEPNYYALAQEAVIKHFAKNKIVDIVVGESACRSHKKMPLARANFSIAPGERCCLIIDDTFASTVKKGACLTEKGIYLCGKNLPATHIPWKKIAESPLSLAWTAGFRIGETLFEFGLQTSARDKLYAVLEEVRQKASASSESAASGDGRTQTQYAQILSAATRYYTFIGNSGHMHVGLENVMKSGHVYTRACEVLGMPRSSNCYVLYSDALYGFAKGFALCDTGLYLLAEYGAYAGQPVHLALPRFKQAELRTEGNHLYINDYGFYIFEGARITQVVDLLKNLQNRI